MDNPGVSLFQDNGNAINILNEHQNHEEVEDLEEQQRRQEELQNLLTNALDDFKYEDSTVNTSSNVSVVSDHNYKDFRFDEQFKVLYEVKLRELNNLKQEFDNYRIDKEKENTLLNQKLLVCEAELRHFHISLKNADSLIEEKMSLIKGLEKSLHEKNEIIDKLKKENDQNQFEICAYKSTINELQTKLDDNNPFNVGAKRIQSEELQKAHQEQIEKLESILEKQIKKTESLEHENCQLKEGLGKMYTSSQQIEIENNQAVTYFSTNLNNAQQQCHDLLNVVEALTKENDHIRERLKAAESNNPTEVVGVQNALDYISLPQHIDKLKELLLDKDTELSSLKTKLRFYERDMRELLEYRDVKSNIISFDFNACGDIKNKQQIIIAQNELKNLQKLINEKDNHIASLEVVNQELQERIEEMLKQTRDEIQNISHKYSLPQLEMMSADLNEAQQKVKQLENALQIAQSKEKELLDFNHNLGEMYKSTKSQLESIESQFLSIQEKYVNEKQKFEYVVKNLQNDFQNAENEISRLQKILMESKRTETELKEQNIKLEEDLSITKHCLNEAKNLLNVSNFEKSNSEMLKSEHEQLEMQSQKTGDELTQAKKIKYNDNHIQESSIIKQLTVCLAEAENEMSTLEETIKELVNSKTTLEREKSNLEGLLGECQENLQTSQKETNISEASDKNYAEFNALKQCYDDLENKSKNLGEQIMSLQEELLHRDNIIERCQEEKLRLEEALQDFKGRLVSSKQETDSLHKEILEFHVKLGGDRKDRAINTSAVELDSNKFRENEELHSRNFEKGLQSKILNYELKLQEYILKDYISKLHKVEEKYQKVLADNDRKYNGEINKLIRRENNFRFQFSQMLEECSHRISEMEARNQDLKYHLSTVEKEFSEHKFSANQKADELIKLLQKVRFDAQNTISSWKNWSKSLLAGCMDVEKVSQKSLEKVLYTIKGGNAKVAALEKGFDERMRKLEKHL